MFELFSRINSEAPTNLAVFGNTCKSSSGHSLNKNKSTRLPLHPQFNIEGPRQQSSRTSLPSLHDVPQENSSKSEPKVKPAPIKPKRIEREISKAYQDIIKKQPHFENLDLFKRELQNCLAPLPAFHGRRLITRMNEQERCLSLNSLNTITSSQQQKTVEDEEDDKATQLLKKLFTNEGIIACREPPLGTLITENEPLDKIYTLGSSKTHTKTPQTSKVKRVSQIRDSSPQIRASVSFKNFKLFEETFLRINLPQSINKENFECRQIGVEKLLTGRSQKEGSKTERRPNTRVRTHSSFRIGTECSEDKSIITRSHSKILTGKTAQNDLTVTGNNTEKRMMTSEGENKVYLRNKSTGALIRVTNGEIKQGLSLIDLSKKENTLNSERRIVSCHLTQKNPIVNICELKDTSIMDTSDSNIMEMYMKQIQGKKEKNL